jgi:hypothetical protein
MQSGLSGGGQGTGYINFQNYEENAPSQAGNISAAVTKVIGGEDTNLTTAETGIKKGIAGAEPAPFTDQAGADTVVGGLLDPGSIATSGGSQKIEDWMNGHHIGDKVDYTQGDDYTKGTPMLTETPVEGGTTTPSVLDYLAKDQIGSGSGYTQGDRMLDTSLLSADAGAQGAIEGNRALNKKFQDRVTTEIPALQKQAGDINTTIDNTARLAGQGLTDTGEKLKGDVEATTKAANDNPTPATIAANTAAAKAYMDWYNNGGGKTGGVWTPTGQGQGQTAKAPVPMGQAIEANTIWKLQHPGDNDPKHLPYPDVTKTGTLPSASTIGGSGTAGAPDITVANQLGSDGWTIGGHYQNAVEDPANPAWVNGVHAVFEIPTAGHANDSPTHIYQEFSPFESAAYVAMHPEKASSYPPVTQDALSGAKHQLEQLIALWSHPTGQMNPAGAPKMVAQFTKALAAVNAKLSSMGGGGAIKSPYDYGKSIGMTDAQLAGMGISPHGNQQTSIALANSGGGARNIK